MSEEDNIEKTGEGNGAQLEQTKDVSGGKEDETNDKSGKNDEKKIDMFNLEDFDMGVTLGTGSFGRVRIAKFKADLSRICAIKMLKKMEIVKLNQVEHIIAEKVTYSICIYMGSIFCIEYFRRD